MIKQELTYAEKFQDLTPFHEAIFTEVKKDLRDDHLRQDKGFLKRNFSGKQLNKITVQELLEVYTKLIAAGYDAVSEFVANRWLLRHIEIYNLFEDRLRTINSQFHEIVELDPEAAKSLLSDAVERFGAVDCYIFSVLNSVCLPEALLKELRIHATRANTPSR